MVSTTVDTILYGTVIPNTFGGPRSMYRTVFDRTVVVSLRSFASSFSTRDEDFCYRYIQVSRS